MKNKLSSTIINVTLCVLLVFIVSVGYVGATTTSVKSESKNLYYRANKVVDGVCLTFNVYENTSNVYKINSLLKEYDATATFFLGGCWADDNVECIRELFNCGHEIGSHGYFHKQHDKMSYIENLHEIEPSVRLINEICLTKIELFAPPSGAYNEQTLLACEKLNMKVIMWSRDTIDWRDKDEKIIFKRATEGLELGEIVLMHPTDATVVALEDILKYLSENGIKTYTVSQCIGE